MAAQSVLPSGEKAFKMCYSELFKGITNDQADGLIADLYGNELLTPSERDQLYDAPTAQTIVEYSGEAHNH